VPKIPLKPAVLIAALAAAALLAACGSNTTETVTVTHTQTLTQSEAATSTTTSTHASATSSTTSTSGTLSATVTTTPTATSTTEQASTTRTETGPAFVGTTTTPSGALGAAAALLLRKGYTPLDTSTYRAQDTLRVLIGRAAGGERAFFFDQGSYLGTDASTASGQITVLGQNDTEVTLDYATYKTGAAAPSGSRRVRFALDMGQLSPLDAIPSVSVRR
jgi:LppP/LprE lipoprotein